MSERMTFNYAKLRGRIVEKLGTIQKAAEAADIRSEQFTDAFKGRRTFTQTEIVILCNVLEIPSEEIPAYFFEQ